MAILNWRDHPRLRFVDFPPPFLTKGSVYIAEDRGDTAWISDGTTYLQLYPDTNLVPQEYTWAARPAPGSPGRVIRVSDVGPAPGIEMVDSGTRWRPSGGRQVLAMRADNQVTVQNLTGAVAETIGPFPGGLVLPDMTVDFRNVVRMSAFGTGTRTAQMLIGNSIPITPSQVTSAVTWYINNSPSSDLSIEIPGSLNVATSAVRGIPRTNVYGIGPANANFSVDFSLPWYVQIYYISAAETAVNISSATWAGGIATFNTSAAHTLAVGDKTVIASVTPSGWNIPDGAIVLSVPTSTRFTVALAADPGAYTSGGTSSRISNVISQSYVLELVG